jgi:hypothetical protein
LGAWIFGTLCVDVIAYANWRMAGTVLENVPPEAGRIVETFGAQSSSALLRYSAAEGDRFFIERWGMVAIILAALLVVAMFFAVDRRLLPTVFAAFLLALALFQYFSVGPELAYRTRQIDFPPGRGNPAAEQRARAIAKIYVSTDGAEVFLGMVLSVYVLMYRSRRRTHSRRAPANEMAAQEAREQG